jgi:hypothetical protein
MAFSSKMAMRMAHARCKRDAHKYPSYARCVGAVIQRIAKGPGISKHGLRGARRRRKRR